MDQGLDARLAKVLAQRIPRPGPNDIVLEDVPLAASGKCGNARSLNFKTAPVAFRDFTPMFQPNRKVAQLHTEHRGLNIVEQRGLAMVVILSGLAILPVIAQPARHLRDFGSFVVSAPPSPKPPNTLKG